MEENSGKPKKQRNKKEKENKIIGATENKIVAPEEIKTEKDILKISKKEIEELLEKPINPIVLTVAMPLFDMAKIAWLAFEGLVAQQNIDFKWELLIIEEKIGAFGLAEVEKYRAKLKELGCERIEYISIDEWVPLGQKWKILAQTASKTSKCFLLQAGDCLPHNTRLADTYKQFEKNDKLDFYDEQFALFYHLHSRKMIVYDVACQRVSNTGCNMAWRTDLIAQLPDNIIPKNVDNFIFGTLGKIKGSVLQRVRKSELNPTGLDSHGLNKISKAREQAFVTVFPPFYETKYRLNSTMKNTENIDIPAIVKERLLNL